MKKNKKFFLDLPFKKYFNETKVFKFLIKESDPIILDIGGNLGQSVKLFKKIFKDSIIHTFEPNELIFKKLQENTKKFDNVFYYNFGLGEKNNKLKLNINKENYYTTSSFLKFNKESVSLKKNYHPKISFNPRNIDKIDGEIKKTEDILKNFKIIDILKIDIQGGELSFLKGIKNFTKIKVIKIEIVMDDLYKFNSQQNFSKILNLLIKNNFIIYDVCNLYKALEEKRTLSMDLIFTNNSFFKLNNF